MSGLLRLGALAVLSSLNGVAWSQAANPCPAWSVEGGQAGAYLGYCVALAGDVNGDGYDDVIVGAVGFDNGQSNEGGAVVYLGSASGLSTSAAWTAESDQANAELGKAVAAAGDVNGDGYDDVIVGAPGFDNGETNEGGAFVYLGSASGLAATPAWTAEGGPSSAFVGWTVGGAGDVNGDGYDDVIVGFEARVYLGSASGLSTSAAWVGPAVNSVAGAGDVNGDGYDDVVVGPGAGEADLYLGSATGPSASPAWTWVEQELYFHAASVAGAGDVNGDGYGDVLVGVPGCCDYLLDESLEGRVDAYLGSSTGLSTVPDWSLVGPGNFGPDALLGSSVSAAGDVNGDGYGDVVLGAPGPGAGRVYVSLGSSTGLSSALDFGDGRWGFGSSVSGGGDVDGDGYDDAIIGSEQFGNGQTEEGRAQVFLGSAVGLFRSAAFAGDSINLDLIVPVNAIVGSSWSAPLRIRHPHGSGGATSLMVRSQVFNGPNFTSPHGGRLTEFLVTGPFLATISGTHGGEAGNIPTQLIPNQAALIGIPWAAQYVVVGGGFGDLSQAVFGIVTSCP